jgi:hypothetical protein
LFEYQRWFANKTKFLLLGSGLPNEVLSGTELDNGKFILNTTMWNFSEGLEA